MAKRQNTVKVPSEAVQGEGSFVVLSKLTMAQAKSVAKSAKTMSNDGEVALEITTDVLRDHVVEWDWVDNDGSRLPLPKDDETVLDKLTTDETKFLIEALIGSEAKKKPSSSA